MAGDWIKMRTNLRRHPKVVRIASALDADRLRVVGGLHAVWSLFDEHSEDGRLSGYTPKSIDDEIGWSGFSAQMEAVGWLAGEPNAGLFLPEFSTHNGASAKRRAQESDRKRNEREAVRKASAPNADKKRTREEKRREDIDKGFTLPDWVHQDAWDGFEEMRKRLKKPMTDRARKLLVADLSKLKDKGHNPNAALDRSTQSGWLGVYEPKGTPANDDPYGLKGAL